MSIDLKDWDKIYSNYNKVANKVESILGYDAINSDHYGSAILYNEYINIETSKNKIIEIHKKFISICESIANILIKYQMDLKDEYFLMDPMSGMLTVFGIRIDVYNNIKSIKSATMSFAKMYKKVKVIAEKYNGIDEKFFCYGYTDVNGRIFYRLYNLNIPSNISDIELESIISKYFYINKKINSLLSSCGYKNQNQIYPFNGRYYLFGKVIDESTNESELIKIIYQAQLFESNIQLVVKDFKILDTYEVIYNQETWVKFVAGHRFSIDMDYSKITNEFQDMDRWCNFKKDL